MIFEKIDKMFHQEIDDIEVKHINITETSK